ncbi:MAG: ribosome-binding factor A [Acidimicrobiales bacterium]|nr:ribosome-binding factor A [Acidimicrobiales bacterium]
MARRQRSRGGYQTARDYPRTARLNELFREIIAEELEQLDATWTAEISITGVDVDADLRKARVFFDSLDADPQADAAAVEELSAVRIRLQSAIARQARTRRAPELTFLPDPAVREGERIDQILGQIELVSSHRAIEDQTGASGSLLDREPMEGDKPGGRPVVPDPDV